MNPILIKIKNVLLFVAGSLLMLIGLLILISPVEFYSSNNIQLGSSISLLNELKAPAGFLLASGLLMICAIFVRSLTDSALWLATLIYLSYAASRMFSMGLDGIPAAGLVQAAVIEGLIGIVSLAVLLISRMPAGRFS